MHSWEKHEVQAWLLAGQVTCCWDRCLSLRNGSASQQRKQWDSPRMARKRGSAWLHDSGVRTEASDQNAARGARTMPLAIYAVTA